ncbi:uncharacterized protein LOC102801989 [Saccoglossus kowalevskii]|uniref:Neurogenic locus notch homolog protein 1-like n=1 Tax=Saccoglossus kowalevskii TaxID=10224 RepID=A0ABM0LU81_SACKO|nr:PREDICTED: neurogenic locus notch homolog protein 1-like [Saccoglossus kowalevskii]
MNTRTSAVSLACVTCVLILATSTVTGFFIRRTDPCRLNRCLNGGRCHALSGSGFYCSCPRGYHGSYCSLGNGMCEYHQCHNGGTCVDIGGWATCRCFFGYYGRDCSASVCDDFRCNHGGTCVVDFDSPKCQCRDNHHGDHCQFSSTS